MSVIKHVQRREQLPVTLVQNLQWSSLLLQFDVAVSILVYTVCKRNCMVACVSTCISAACIPCVDSLAVGGKGSWNLSLLGRVCTLMKNTFYCKFMNIQCTMYMHNVDAYTCIYHVQCTCNMYTSAMPKGDETNRDPEDGSDDTTLKGMYMYIHMHVHTYLYSVQVCSFLYADFPIQYLKVRNLCMYMYIYTCVTSTYT